MELGFGERDAVVSDRGLATTLAEEKFNDIESLALNLVRSINSIRESIRCANENSAINDKIQKISDLERELGVLETLNRVNTKVFYGPRRDYGSRDYVIHEKDYEKQMNELKFRISELKDSTNGQNASLEVELSSTTQKVAEQLGIPL
jgi:hypothetical protein